MKKLLLLALSAGIGFGANAQVAKSSVGASSSHDVSNLVYSKGLAAGKTTAVGDTFTFTNMIFAAGNDTVTTYFAGSAPFDSGYVFGTNFSGDKAWAERYSVKGTDSTMSVLGVIVRFDGNYNSATTKTINLNAWSQGPKTNWLRPTLFNSGFPNTVLASRSNVSIKNLGIGLGTIGDTDKVFFFTTPTAYLTTNFFVGYDINYTWGAALNGDTIGLKSNRQGERHTVGYTVSGTDTIVNNQNATMYDDGVWHDNLQESFAMFNHLYVFPICKIGAAVNNSVSSISKNGLTFYGSYPNPAANSTNVKFALANSTDVTIEVMDATGKIIFTNNNTNLSAGEHTIKLETATLPAGMYVYLVRTAEGDGIASQLSVIK